MQGTQAQFLGQEDPLEEEMSTHSSILAWEIPWTEEPGGLQSTGLQRVRHDWVTEQQPAKGCGQRHVLLASISGWPGGSCSSPIILTFQWADSRDIPGLSRGEKHSFSWAFFPLLILVSILHHYFPNHILHNPFYCNMGNKKHSVPHTTWVSAC